MRQGRDIEGRALVTQHKFTVDWKTGRTPHIPQAIAFSEHSSTYIRAMTAATPWTASWKGDLVSEKAFGPAQPGQVPYGAMLPKGIDNLIVPVSLSCTRYPCSAWSRHG